MSHPVFSDIHIYHRILFLNSNSKHGPVRHVVLGTLGLEHKALAGPFARSFPKATVWLQPGQWSFPLPIPAPLLGFPLGPKLKTLGDGAEPEWASDIEFEILGPLRFKSVGAFGETAFFHKSSSTLLVTDTIVRVDDAPPPIIEEDPRALLFHARDEIGEEVQFSVNIFSPSSAPLQPLFSPSSTPPQPSTPLQPLFNPSSTPIQPLINPSSTHHQLLVNSSSNPLQLLFNPSSTPMQILCKSSATPLQPLFNAPSNLPSPAFTCLHLLSPPFDPFNPLQPPSTDVNPSPPNPPPLDSPLKVVDTRESRAKGWRRICLFGLIFYPSSIEASTPPPLAPRSCLRAYDPCSQFCLFQ